MTPDSFYQIKPDVKPGSVNDHYRHQPVHRMDKRPQRDFGKVLDRKEQNKAKNGTDDEDLLTQKDAAHMHKKGEAIDESGDNLKGNGLVIGKEGVSQQLGDEIVMIPSDQQGTAIDLKALAASQSSGNNTGDMAGKLGKNLNMPEVSVQPHMGALQKEQAEALADAAKIKKSPADLFSEEARLRHSDILKNDKNDAAGIVAPAHTVILGDNTVAQADAVAKTSKASELMKDLAAQLIDQLSVVTDKTRTETVILLKQPPLLEGATVTITSYNSAKGEFNISFDNLTQQAKNVLDMAANRTSLLDAMDQKGFTVHIITTSTIERNYDVQTGGLNQNNEKNQDSQQQKPKEEKKR